MTNNKNIFYFLIASIFILTSCGTDDPEKNGIKAGKIVCESEEIREEIEDLEDDISDIQEDIYDLDWDDDDDRLEIAELRKEEFEIGKKIQKLYIKNMKLNMKYEKLKLRSYSAIEDEDDRADWLEDFEDAKDDYIDDNCD
ncbi:MAG: hypothetical protein CMD15_03115 [Flavobacteriales bacterium]|nr:hypothetical protein [Flavobacteriales bacterium]|tara:strand:+ start:44705 stop:45127 length:423 start_codon:yes stop_codon:yes gene_type:complete